MRILVSLKHHKAILASRKAILASRKAIPANKASLVRGQDNLVNRAQWRVSPVRVSPVRVSPVRVSPVRVSPVRVSRDKGNQGRCLVNRASQGKPPDSRPLKPVSQALWRASRGRASRGRASRADNRRGQRPHQRLRLPPGRRSLPLLSTLLPHREQPRPAAAS